MEINFFKNRQKKNPKGIGPQYPHQPNPAFHEQATPPVSPIDSVIRPVPELVIPQEILQLPGAVSEYIIGKLNAAYQGVTTNSKFYRQELQEILDNADRMGQSDEAMEKRKWVASHDMTQEDWNKKFDPHTRWTDSAKVYMSTDAYTRGQVGRWFGIGNSAAQGNWDPLGVEVDEEMRSSVTRHDTARNLSLEPDGEYDELTGAIQTAQSRLPEITDSEEVQKTERQIKNWESKRGWTKKGLAELSVANTEKDIQRLTLIQTAMHEAAHARIQ